MENASKALLMAGSVLISMLIIGAFVFMFNSLKGFKKIEATSEQIAYMEEYNKKIESYNRQIYGSELISLANLMADYNTYTKTEQDQYDVVKLEVNINHPMAGSKYMGEKKYNVNSFTKAVDTLESRIKYLKNPKYFSYTTKDKKVLTVDKISSMRHRELVEAFGSEEEANNISNKPEVAEYGDLRTELTNFKNKEFNTPEVEYNKSSGRITKITFTDREVN